MRIGVVCEGPTDYHAISLFFQAALFSYGINAHFLPIQPVMDNTNPVAGWGNVLLWLKNKPPSSRVQQYFAGGLFGGPLSMEPLNCIILHLDSDILADASFCTYVSDTYGYVVANPPASNDRADQIRHVLSLAANFDQLTNGDKSRHVFAVAVEATEAWCVAAFKMPIENTETLVGQALIDEFMSALERSEGNDPNPPYARINKSVKRRKRFCQTHHANYDRVVQGCDQFSQTLQRLLSLA
jgi:hypothetical protein